MSGLFATDPYYGIWPKYFLQQIPFGDGQLLIRYRGRSPRASPRLHRLELIHDAINHCGDAGKKRVGESLLARASVLRAGRNTEELRTRDRGLSELRFWTEVQDSGSFQYLARIGVYDDCLAAEDNARGHLAPVPWEHDRGHARRIHIGQRIDAYQRRPAIAGRAHECAWSGAARILLHRLSVFLASVRDDAKPVSRSTRIGEKVERIGHEAFRSIDRHASGLAVSPVGVNRHAYQWCCVAAVSVSWWEWDVWHRSVAVSEVQPHKLDRMCVVSNSLQRYPDRVKCAF